MPKSITKMKVSIESLTFETIIGILPFERENKQTVILDIYFSYKFKKNQKEFIDYSSVANMAQDIMEKEKFELIEDAIIHLSQTLKSKLKLKKITIKITKPNIMKNCIVSVGN